ncbi:hypothetical protein JOB18_009778, partial [Solea senegalensis]
TILSINHGEFHLVQRSESGDSKGRRHGDRKNRQDLPALRSLRDARRGGLIYWQCASNTQPYPLLLPLPTQRCC